MNNHGYIVKIEGLFGPKWLPFKEMIDEASVSRAMVNNFKFIESHSEHDSKVKKEYREMDQGVGGTHESQVLNRFVAR